jgi:aspartate aminotransferase
VYSEAALRELAKLARRRDFFLVSDEAYEKYVYDGRRHVSPASLGDAARRTVTVHTFSKTWCMTGFRVGWLAAPAEVARAAARAHGHATGNVCTFAQHGALAALKLGAGHDERMRRLFERRRDAAFAAAAAFSDSSKPAGGFFLFADVRRRLGRFKSTARLAEHLLREKGVAVLPGSACGLEGRLRLSFSGAEKDVAEGLRRVQAALCG